MFCASCGATISTPDGSSGRCDACGQVTTTSANPYAPSAVRAPAADPYQASPGSAIDAAFSGEDRGPPISLDTIPPPPRVPTPRARSLVFGYQGGQRASLMVGLIFMAVGCITSFAFGQGIGSDLLLAFFGSPAQGTVIESHAEMNVRVNGAHPTLIRFRYKAGSETLEGESSTLDRSLVKAAGAPIKIELLTSMPSVARAAGTTCSAIGYFGIFVFIFPCIGAMLTFSAVRSNRREIRAFVHGKPTLARVVSRGLDTRVRVNGQSPTKIVWEFDANGQSYKGDISHMSPMALGNLMHGASVVVLYDPRNPKINTVWVS